jgi:predicted unusual protein kinase regulating ubiquinone biosynthesis (AarF/ABC1/UbiB family)
MTFIPGQTMTEFEKHYNKKIRSYVARIGAGAFFEMLFQHNFTHVDCHGGNIMVKINKDYTIWTELRDYFRIIRSYFMIKVIKLFLHTDYLKYLAD